MIAFDPVESIHASRTQLYEARRAAMIGKDHAAHNAIQSLIDLAMWPCAAGGLAAAVGFPAVLGGVTCTSITNSRKEIQR